MLPLTFATKRVPEPAEQPRTGYLDSVRCGLREPQPPLEEYGRLTLCERLYLGGIVTFSLFLLVMGVYWTVR